ncbi:hypothetical protein Tco_1184413 [Tanacetum coccineum]
MSLGTNFSQFVVCMSEKLAFALLYPHVVQEGEEHRAKGVRGFAQEQIRCGQSSVADYHDFVELTMDHRAHTNSRPTGYAAEMSSILSEEDFCIVNDVWQRNEPLCATVE